MIIGRLKDFMSRNFPLSRNSLHRDWRPYDYRSAFVPREAVGRDLVVHSTKWETPLFLRKFDYWRWKEGKPSNTQMDEGKCGYVINTYLLHWNFPTHFSSRPRGFAPDLFSLEYHTLYWQKAWYTTPTCRTRLLDCNDRSLARQTDESELMTMKSCSAIYKVSLLNRKKLSSHLHISPFKNTWKLSFRRA